MLKQGTFIRKKYRILFICNIFTSASYFINLMVDAVLGGHQLGETALTAVSIVAPLFSVVYFIDYMLTPGMGILYGKHSGAFDSERAYRTAGQSLVCAFLTGLFLLLSLLLLKEPFLRYFGCTGALYAEASTYYNWVVAYAAIHPFNVSLYYLILADSDALIAMLGTVAEIVTNITLSSVLSPKIGIAGLGIATTLGNLLSVLLFPLHLLRKNNSIRFQLCLCREDCKKAFLLSLSRCTSYLFIAAVDIVMNKIILIFCGVAFIPAYSVVNLAFSVFGVTCASFDAGAGFLSVFLGEKNNYGIRLTARYILRADIGMNLVFMLLFFFGAPLLPEIYGMTSPEVASVSVQTSRIMAFAALPYGLGYLGSMLYPALEKPGMGFAITFLNDLLCPLLLSVPFVCILGIIGVSAGMAAGEFLMAALFSVIVCGRHGKKGFPLYLPEYGESAAAFDLDVTEENAKHLREQIERALAAHGFELSDIGLLIESLYAAMRERNPHKKVLSECVLLFGRDTVRILIRDNGSAFDYGQEAEIPEAVRQLLDRAQEKNYTLTTSFNRSGFVFSRQDSA